MNIPQNISGIDYELVKKYAEISTIYDKINLNDVDIQYPITNNKIHNPTIDDIIRLEPPYMISCSHSDTNKCQKKAGFQLAIDNKYYCWFHVRCFN